MGTALQPSLKSSPLPFRSSFPCNGPAADPAELRRGVRGSGQQADQHGALRQLCLCCPGQLLQQSRPGSARICLLLQEVLLCCAPPWGVPDGVPGQAWGQGGAAGHQQASRMDWGTPLEAMTAVLELEKTVTQTLQQLQTVAAQKNDFHLTDFIQQEFVVKKVNIIKEIGDMITKIKMVSNGTGIFTVDQELQKAVVVQTLVDLQNVVFKVKHCQVNQAQVETVKEIVDCLATVTL